MRKQVSIALLASIILLVFVLLHQRKSCEECIFDALVSRPTGLINDHIFFLKIHKCGSSTVQNILMRRGFKKGLNFVLPKEGHYLGHGELFSKDLMDQRYLTGIGHFDIFTHHTRFSAVAVKNLMPPDTKKITILREPTALFESLYNYYRLNRAQYGYSLANLLENDGEELRDLSRYLPRWGGVIGFNQIAFDAGLAPYYFEDEARVDDLIAIMDAEFDLVMISEQMEVSLVLMAEVMGWSLLEVTSIKLNARAASNSTFRTELTDLDKLKLQILNPADVKIYDHFARKFEQRVKEYGEEKMELTVAKLKRLNEKLMDRCVQDIIPPQKIEPHSLDYPVFTYQLHQDVPDICKVMVMPELEFTELLKSRQLLRFGFEPEDFPEFGE